ncbi:MAG: hypothetical protein ACI88H_001414 [Cocleimonas sp.]|jgi:hypothetical protein
MVKKLKSGPLNELSSKLAKFQELPFGTEFRLYRKKTGRRVRSDITIKRKAVNSKNISRLGDSWNVKDLIDQTVAFLSTDITARDLEMQLFAPNSSRINGNTLLGNVRKLDPKVDDESNDNRTLKVFNLLASVLENSGIEDVTITQIGQLYNQLNEILNNTFDSSLLESESKILSASL